MAADILNIAQGKIDGIRRSERSSAPELPPIDVYADDVARLIDAPPRDFPPVEAYAEEMTRRRVASDRAPTVCEPFNVTAIDDIDEPAPADVVQGLFGRGDLIALVGAPNAGKTALGIDLSLSIAAGEPWFGMKVTPGPTVYFAPEAPGSVIMRARAAINRKYPNRRLPFYIARGTPQIGGEHTSVADAERMIATVHKVESHEGEASKLVQIDTLASCLGDGDENGPGMIRLVAASKYVATTLGTAVMLIHHPSKGDTAGLRGHGSLAAACDAIISVAVDELSGIRTATLVKSRDSATGAQWHYRLDPVALMERDSFGDPRSTIVVVPELKSVARPRPSGARQQTLLTELERRYRAGETGGWDEATVRQAGAGLGMQRSSCFDAVKGLIKSGYLVGASSRLTLKFPPETT